MGITQDKVQQAHAMVDDLAETARRQAVREILNDLTNLQSAVESVPTIGTDVIEAAIRIVEGYHY
jgi:hypothetical protein